MQLTDLSSVLRHRRIGNRIASSVLGRYPSGSGIIRQTESRINTGTRRRLPAWLPKVPVSNPESESFPKIFCLQDSRFEEEMMLIVEDRG